MVYTVHVLARELKQQCCVLSVTRYAIFSTRFFAFNTARVCNITYSQEPDKYSLCTDCLCNRGCKYKQECCWPLGNRYWCRTNRHMDFDTWIRCKLNERDSLRKWYIRGDILDRDFQHIRASMCKNQRRFVLCTRRSFRKGMVGRAGLVAVVRLKQIQLHAPFVTSIWDICKKGDLRVSYKLTRFNCTLNKWIARVASATCASWYVINYMAISQNATRSGTWISAFAINARHLVGTFTVTDALRSAVRWRSNKFC